MFKLFQLHYEAVYYYYYYNLRLSCYASPATSSHVQILWIRMNEGTKNVLKMMCYSNTEPL